jgi:hypothetical protein
VSDAPPQHLQNDIEAKKTITLFPTPEQRRDNEHSFTLEEGEVYALDVIVTSGEDVKVNIHFVAQPSILRQITLLAGTFFSI